MPEVDTKLAQSLRQAKSAPMNFVFIAKGASDGALLVAKGSIPPKEILQAKERCGGGAVIRGRCHGEDGVTVFEVGKEPAATLAGQLRKIITRDAGMTLHVETRFAADLTEGDAGAPAAPPAPPVTSAAAKPAAPPAPPPSPSAAGKPAAPAAPPAAPPPAGGVDAAGFKTRLKEVMPAYQQAGQKAPERKAELDGLAGKAGAAAKTGDFAGGVALLNRVAELSAMVLKTSEVPPPPTVVDPSTEFKDRFKALRPAFDKASAWAKANALERADELDGLLAQTFDAAKAKRFDDAFASLDLLTRAIEAANAAAQGKTAEKTAPTGDEAEAFKNRLKAVLPLYQEAITKAPDRKAELSKLATDATNAGKGKDFAKAMDLLDKLEAASNGAIRTAGVASEIGGAVGKGNVAYRRRLLAWQAAKSKAGRAMQKLKKSILDDPEAAVLSNWEQIKKGAQGIMELIAVFDEFDVDLSDALDAADGAATPKERDDSKKEALAVVKKYQAELADPIYDQIDGNVYGNDIKVKAVLAQELDALAAALA